MHPCSRERMFAVALSPAGLCQLFDHSRTWKPLDKGCRVARWTPEFRSHARRPLDEVGSSVDWKRRTNFGRAQQRACCCRGEQPMSDYVAFHRFRPPSKSSACNAATAGARTGTETNLTHSRRNPVVLRRPAKRQLDKRPAEIPRGQCPITPNTPQGIGHRDGSLVEVASRTFRLKK